jgi:hypothetical protein
LDRFAVMNSDGQMGIGCGGTDEQACYGCSDDQAWASAANHGGNACERRFYHVAIYGR